MAEIWEGKFALPSGCIIVVDVCYDLIFYFYQFRQVPREALFHLVGRNPGGINRRLPHVGQYFQTTIGGQHEF